MYKFIIEDKEYSIGKLCLTNSSILAYEDQSIIKSLNGVSINSCEIIDPKKILIKNNALNYWSYKEILGKIAFNLSIAATTENERLEKLNKVKNMLADESVIQIKNSTGSKFYKAILLLGSIDDTLDTNSFNIMYGFNEDDCGIGLYPLEPSFIKTMLNGKDLTVVFKKGANAVSTKFIVNGNEYITQDESITISLAEYETKYSIEIYSISGDGIVGQSSIKNVTTPKYIEEVAIPQNLTVKAIIGRYVTLTFTKGLNTTKTEIVLGNIVTQTYDEEVTILASDYNTTYDLKIRGISSTGAYSEYTDVMQITTLEPIIPLPPVINILDISEDIVTFGITKGKDAISTEFVVDGVIYVTENTYLVVKIGSLGKTFKYKARSISYTDSYSDYTVEATATTEVESIVPAIPTNISVSMVGSVATFKFTKGTNATSTEFIVDGVNKTTDGTSLVVDIGAYSKTFKYQARSKSSTGNYSDYTIESTATTGVQSIVPTIPTNITVSIAGTVATFNFTKGTNAISTQFVIDGYTYTTTGTSLVRDIGAYSKTFKYKARSKSSTGIYSDYTAEGNATTEELKTSIITFNLVGKIAGSMTECPIKITLDEEEVTQQQYNDAKGNVGLSDAEICVDFTNLVKTYYGGSRANFIKDLISIRLPTDGGGYLFDYRYYEYETTKKSIITSGFSNIITGSNKIEYKIDMATNLSLQIEVKSNIQI